MHHPINRITHTTAFVTPVVENWLERATVHKDTYTSQSKCYYENKEENVLFNDALNTFYLRLYGVRHMVKDHSNSERGNPLPPHGLLFSINSMVFLYASCHRQDNTYHGLCYTSRLTLAETRDCTLKHIHIILKSLKWSFVNFCPSNNSH